MQRRCLGKTGIEVSVLGLGTVKFGRNEGVNYPQSFSLPCLNEMTALLDLAQSCGINLIDTAPAYGASEEWLGKILKGKRDQWIICTKVGEEFKDGVSFFDFTETAIQKSITRSLSRLDTDYLDIVLVHSNGEDERLIFDYQVFSALEKMKQSGQVRAYGMSTKTIQGGFLAVNLSDVVMVTYNPIYSAERHVIDYASEQGKGILVKKGLVSGHLQRIANQIDPVKVCLDFSLSHRGVSSVVVGTLNPLHLKQNVLCIAQ